MSLNKPTCTPSTTVLQSADEALSHRAALQNKTHARTLTLP